MADQQQELSPGAFALGMLMGAVIGFALWMGTDTFVFFPVFLGVGVVFGMMFNAARSSSQGKDDNDKRG